MKFITDNLNRFKQENIPVGYVLQTPENMKALPSHNFISFID